MALRLSKTGQKCFDPELLTALSHKFENAETIANLESIDPKNLVDKDGRTLLHHAAATNNHEIVRYLIGRGCQIDPRDVIGSTPLILAVINKHVPTIEVLLESNADVSVADKGLRNPLRMAFHIGIHWYIDNHMVISTFSAMLKKRYAGNKEALARLLMEAKCSLPQALFLEDVAVTKYMLNNGHRIDERSSRGTLALHVATVNGDLPNVRVLVELGADVNAPDDYLRRPLHLYGSRSSSKGTVELLRFLLERGACPIATDRSNSTAAFPVFRYGSVVDAKLMMDYAVDLSIKNHSERTLLCCAAMNSNFDVIQLFAGTNFEVNAQDRTGYPPLYYAAINANWRGVEFLLKNGADLNIESARGETILALALRSLTELTYYNGRYRGRDPDVRKSIEVILQYAMDSSLVYDKHEIVFFIFLQTTTSSKFAKLLIEHFTVKDCRDESLHAIINSREDLKSYYKECRRKIEEMKSTIIHHQITMFDFLIKKEGQLALYARNPETFAKLKAIIADDAAGSDRFYVVRRSRERILRAINWETIRGKGAANLAKITAYYDVVAIDKIMSFLDELSLYNLSQIV